MSGALLVGLLLALAFLVLVGARAGPEVGAPLSAAALVARLRAAPQARPPDAARGGWCRRDGGPPADAALAMDLVAAALSAGAPVATALAVVAEAIDHAPPGGRGAADGGAAPLARAARLLALGAEPGVAWAGCDDRWAPMARCLVLAQASGAPTAGLLRQAARRVRTDRALRRTAAAHRLGVHVLLPLGLCALPGFAALGVAPVVLALAGSLLR